MSETENAGPAAKSSASSNMLLCVSRWSSSLSLSSRIHFDTTLSVRRGFSLTEYFLICSIPSMTGGIEQTVRLVGCTRWTLCSADLTSGGIMNFTIVFSCQSTNIPEQGTFASDGFVCVILFCLAQGLTRFGGYSKGKGRFCL